MKNQEIIYPRGWSFRVIGMDRKSMIRDIESVMAERKYEVKDSNKKGKYVSLNLMLVVASEDERNTLFTALKGAESVTMVL